MIRQRMEMDRKVGIENDRRCSRLQKGQKKIGVDRRRIRKDWRGYVKDR